jgi:dTDP-4-dehydrorhamnose reductase
MQKILVTGSNSRFGGVLKKIKTKKKFYFRDRKQLNILSIKSIENNIKKFKPNYILHLAGLSRPMSLHEKDISNSINLNIIGTCNLVKIAAKYNLKLIYFSTNYIYQGTRGNYKETDPVKPWNNYGWSKLGGECAVQMYKNSLILRMCMAEKPFVHDKVYANVKSNFIFQDDAARLMLKVLDKKGIINIGGPSKLIYNFVKNNKKDIKKIYSRGEFPKRMDMSLKKLNKIIK